VDLSIVLPLPDEGQRLHCAAEALVKLRGKTLGGAGEQSGWGLLDLLDGPTSADMGRTEDTLRSMMSAVQSAALPARVRSAFAAATAPTPAGVHGAAVEQQSVRATSACPETDTPTGGDAADTAEGFAAAAESGAVGLLLAELRGSLLDFPDDGLDLRLCLRLMLAVSGRWSYRDLKQFFSALNYAIMCSDRYALFLLHSCTLSLCLYC
jgi:hypothetical protein